MSDLNIYKLPLDKIDTQDRSFLFSYPKRDSILKKSIETLGLLTPPIVYPEKDRYIIIDGEGRILACKSLGFNLVSCYILKDKTPQELLIISLKLNLFRGLNLVEKAEFIKKALKLISLKDLIEILPLLEFPKSYIWIEFLQNISNLEDEFKNLLITGRLNPKITQKLSKLRKEERMEFLEVLEGLRLSFSEQKDVLEKLLDLKKRKDLKNLLLQKLKDILKEKDFNKRKRLFFQELNSEYFENYFLKLNKILPILERFKANGLVIGISPYFEKKEINIGFRVKGFGELREKLTFLDENQEDIKRIFEEF